MSLAPSEGRSCDRYARLSQQRYATVDLQRTAPTDRLFQRNELGALVTLEMGKIKTEGIGEVQEFVDIVSETKRKGLAMSHMVNSATMRSACLV
jgi:hypothetical protein